MKSRTKLVLFCLALVCTVTAAELPSEGLIEHAAIVAVNCSLGNNPGTLELLTGEKSWSGTPKRASLPIDITSCIGLETKVRNSIACRGIAWADLYVRNGLVVGADRIIQSKGLCGGWTW